MTNAEQIAAWHADKPEWAASMTARDWSIAELIAEHLDIEALPEPESCMVATEQTGGTYYCTRQKGHEGPCAAHLTDG